LRRQIAAPFIAPLIAALVLIADQLSKHWVVTQLPEGQSWYVTSWLAPVLKLTHVTNTGVAFGLFPNLGILFVIVRLVVVVLIVIYERRLPPDQWLIRAALGLPLGGAIGNLIDRVRLGSVVDFIDLNFWPFETFAVFNLADASIVVGVIVLLLLMLLEERQGQTTRHTVEGGS
jgi:signal peptidase II